MQSCELRRVNVKLLANLSLRHKLGFSVGPLCSDYGDAIVNEPSMMMLRVARLHVQLPYDRIELARIHPRLAMY